MRTNEPIGMALSAGATHSSNKIALNALVKPFTHQSKNFAQFIRESQLSQLQVSYSFNQSLAKPDLQLMTLRRRFQVYIHFATQRFAVHQFQYIHPETRLLCLDMCIHLLFDSRLKKIVLTASPLAEEHAYFQNLIYPSGSCKPHFPCL